MKKKFEYNKNEEKLEIGKTLYHRSMISDVIVEDYDDNYIYCRTAEHGKLPFLWRDLGKVLFFSLDDYNLANDAEFIKNKYGVYQNVNSKKEVRENIDKENHEFFKGKSYHEKELYMEQQKFNDIEKKIKKILDSYKEQEIGYDYVNNGNSDTYDTEISANRTKMRREVQKYTKIYENPYFAKIQLKDDSVIYIGNSKFESDIVDIRDKKYAPLYYEWEYHKSQLNLLRKLIIEKAEFKDFQDLYNLISEDKPVVMDELLSRIIEHNRELNDVVNIAESIQAKQYRIISRPLDENILVEGCAGSGKTMILLHRISSIIFNKPDKYHPSDLIIISPNNVLDSQSNILLDELDLSEIIKDSICNLYIKWIYSYVRLHGLILKDYSSLDREVYDNTQTYGDAIHVLYQDDIANDFDEILKAIIENPFKIVKGYNFIEIEKERIRLYQTKIYGGHLDINEPLWIFFKNISKKYEEICHNLSYNNAQAKCDAIKERISLIEKNNSNYDEYRLKQVVDDYIKNRNILDESLEFKRDELISKCEELKMIKEGEAFFEKMLCRERKKYIKIAIDNIVDEISEIKREISRLERNYNNKTKKIYDDRELKTLRKQYDALNMFLQSGDLKGADVKTKENKLSLIDSLYKQAFELYITIEDKIPIEMVKLNGTLGGFMHSNYTVMDRIDRYEKFISGDKKRYLIEIIESIIWFHKDIFDVNNSNFYEFELYYILRGLQLLYGPLDKDNKLVSIDEYQDYSPIEIETIQKIFPNAIFNLYGETLQNINEKGVTSLDNQYYSNYNVYKLNTNYRNGKEITQYINDCFSTKMDAIGISSIVNVIDSKKIENQKYDGNERVALIVKSLKIYDELIYNKTNDNVFIDDTVVVDRNKINVIPIKLAKGLEFEVVYVFEKEMTKNEKYVAYSRALKELNIMH